MDKDINNPWDRWSRIILVKIWVLSTDGHFLVFTIEREEEIAYEAEFSSYHNFLLQAGEGKRKSNKPKADLVLYVLTVFKFYMLLRSARWRKWPMRTLRIKKTTHWAVGRTSEFFGGMMIATISVVNSFFNFFKRKMKKTIKLKKKSFMQKVFCIGIP